MSCLPFLDSQRRPSARNVQLSPYQKSFTCSVYLKNDHQVVSTAFTILVLSPLLIMFAMWAKIGANVSNLQLNVPTLLFHVGLACIFGLYYMFWTQLDMFYTLKMLLLIGGATFLGGNKMLADMAAARYRS